MIKATFNHYDEIRYLKLNVKGHAGADVEGHDLVCASASTLLYTLAQTVHDIWERGDLDTEPIIITDEGNGLITCQCNTDQSYAEAVNAFNVIWTGFNLLAHNYPQYVELYTVG